MIFILSGVSKHWKPGKKIVRLDATARPAARPSRIRREPVQLNPNIPTRPARPVNTRERELFFGIVGIMIFGVAIAAALIGFSAFTTMHDDPAADVRAAQFSQCYNAEGPNCVLDGQTFYITGKRVDIAGIEAPGIVDARCDREHDRGVAAAVGLVELLNSGPVSISRPFRDQDGRRVRSVEVRGRDVALTMIARDMVHQADSGLSWC